MGWRDFVTFEVELSTGAYATELIPGGEWDVDQWDDTGVALWAGTRRIWTPITCDYVSATIKTGRARYGENYKTGNATIMLQNDDGVYSPSAPIEADINLVAGRLIRVVAVIDYLRYPIFTGTVRSVRDRRTPGQAAITTVSAIGSLQYLGRVDRLAGAAVGGGELTGARIERLLASIAWPDHQAEIDAGQETVQATELSANMLTEAYATAASEGGELFADGSGMIIFRDRASVEAKAAADPVFTVSDRAIPGPVDDYVIELADGTTWTDSVTGRPWTSHGGVSLAVPGMGPWLCWADFTPDESLDHVVNSASVARKGGTTQTAVDAASQQQYGVRTYVRTDLLNDSDTWPLELAERVVARRKDASEEVLAVKLTDGDLRAAIALLLSGFGDPILIDRTIAGDLIQDTALIQGYTHVITPTDWVVTIATDTSFDTKVVVNYAG